MTKNGEHMNIEITEADFSNVYTKAEIDVEIKGLGKETLGAPSTEALDRDEKRRRAVFDALPRVLADKFNKMVPGDWCIKEVILKVNISGKPFGVGVEGDATVKFGPKGSDS